MKNVWLFLVTVILLSACSDDSNSLSNTDNPPPDEKSLTDQSQQDSQQSASTDKADNSAELSFSDLTPFKVLNVSEGVYDQTSALQINFNLPVKKDQDLDQMIRVDQAGELIKTDWIFSDNQMALYFPFIDANTIYDVSISQSLSSGNNQVLSQKTVKRIKTQPKQKSARFLSKGNTLLSSDHHLPIEAVNVDAVELKFWRIHDDHLNHFLAYPRKRDIYDLKKLPDMAELVYTGHYNLEDVKNKTERHNISIKDNQALKAAGTYFVTMMPDDATYAYDFESTWFIQTDMGLHTRRYKKSLAIFTHQLPSAKVYPGVKITLFDNENVVLHEVETDNNGFVEIDHASINLVRYIKAQKGNEMNLLRMNQPKLDLSEYKLASRAHNSQELFLYSPRDLFRPGETVNVNGLLRDADGRLVTARPIKVEIKRPDNRLYKEINWQGDESGFYQSEFTLPQDAMTGTWHFSAKVTGGQHFKYAIAVEDFLPERLKLALKVGNESKNVSLNDAPKINIQSDYLYGAPAAENRFDATVTVKPSTAMSEDFPDHSFGSNHETEFEQTFTTDAGTLDAKGYAELRLPIKWKNTAFPLQVKSHVNVYESGGRPISRKIDHVIWPNETAVGIKPMWDGRFASPSQVNTVSLAAINRQGAAIDLDRAEIMLIQETRDRYWHWGDNGWGYRNNKEEAAVYNAVINIEKDADNLVRLPLDYGAYRIEIRDPSQQLLSSYRFFSGWRWYDPYAHSGERPDQVKLAWQADDLIAGQEAVLSVTSPFVGRALVTVESEDLLWHQSIELEAAQTEVKIPVDANWHRHDLHASVMVIQAGDGGAKRSHLPKRALGVIHLPLNRSDRKLDLEVTHTEKTLPDEPLTVTIKAAGVKAGQQTFVTLAAVDTGVLNVSRFKTPKPFEWFFAKRLYTPALKDIYGSLIEMVEGKNAAQKFGGDADLNRGGEQAKSDVQIVSLFTDKVAFNAEGVAEITLDVPYFNGELRLMALAFNDQQFAGASSHVKVAAPIVIETSLPRFMAKGDRSEATIEVHNTEDVATDLSLTITADRTIGGGSVVYEWTLAADEKRVVKLPLTALAYRGLAPLRVVAKASQGSGAASQSNAIAFEMDRTWSLGLRPAMPAVTNQIKALVKPGASYDLAASESAKFDAFNLKSAVKISDTPVLNREDQLYQLLRYPYGCLEQTSSRAWPLLFAEASDYATFAASEKKRLYDERFDVINKAVSRIIGMQIYHGGFALWTKDGDEVEWLTVYAVDFLLQAKKLGYLVPDAPLQKAVTRLHRYIRNSGGLSSEMAQYLSNRNHYEIAYKAYAAYVLADMKQVGLQDVRRLYDEFSKTARSPLPLAHLAMSFELLGDERRANEAWLKALDFKWDRNEYDYYGDYGSKIRDYAEVISLGTQSRLMDQLPKSTLDLVMPLQDDMINRNWLSTQEQKALFKTAKLLKQSSEAGSEWTIDLMRKPLQDHNMDQGVAQNVAPKTAENEEGEVSADVITSQVKQAQDWYQVWDEQAAQSAITFDNVGEKAVYLDIKFQGYLLKHEAESNGLMVKKKYYDLKGNVIDLTKLNSGDNLLVHIEIGLDKKFNYLPDAMLIDLLPAGLELENQNLEHAMKLDDIKIDGKYIRDWSNNNNIKHSEYRDDRFVAAMALSNYRNAHVFYLAKAVTPGDYVVPASLVEDMYRPEIRGSSDDSGHLVIK